MAWSATLGWAMCGYWGFLLLLLIGWMHFFKKLGIKFLYNSKTCAELVQLPEFQQWRSKTTDWCAVATKINKKMFGRFMKKYKHERVKTPAASEPTVNSSSEA